MSSIIVVDSITTLPASSRGMIAVAASHGGRYSAYVAAQAGLRGVVLNDAGVGRDDAGIAALPYLDDLGVAAVTVSNWSARIGIGEHMLACGRVSHCNRTALDLGCRPGQSCEAAVRHLQSGAPPAAGRVELAETRTVVAFDRVPVIAIDSASLIEPADVGTVVITGSHGGLLGRRPETALKTMPLGAVFNDAGIGIDEAGLSRLPILAARGVPAVTVDARTARIGDASSTWKDGVVSRTNPPAARIGARVGMPVPAFAELVGRWTAQRARIAPPAETMGA